jgi:hypothetical protein
LLDIPQILPPKVVLRIVMYMCILLYICMFDYSTFLAF